jgi:transcriptional regulator with XRE-family HTH domain
MSASATDLSDDPDVRLGRTIRELRHSRGLTLVEVAAEAGLSHPFLSQLERGLTRPSMRSLFQIAEALGTTQQALLAAAGGEDATPIDLISGGGARLLGPSPEGVAVTEFVEPPRDFGDFFRHDHAELLYVVAGVIEVEHEQAEGTVLTTVRARGTVGYPGGVDHRFRQVGPGPAVVLAIHGGIRD